MVDLILRYDDFELLLPSGKLVIATPCGIENQKDLVYDLQKKKSRFRIYDQKGNSLNSNIPILIAKQFMNLDGNDLEKHYRWWCEMLALKTDEQDPYFNIIPKNQSGWGDLKIEKKISLFLGAAIKSSQLCYAFLGDLHIDHNAQIFLFNFLKNITDSSQSRAIIFWTYRLNLPHTVPLYFKGFSKDVA